MATCKPSRLACCAGCRRCATSANGWSCPTTIFWTSTGPWPGLRRAGELGIISHGLEGSSERPYVRGMVRALNQAGFDALAWNYRGCGGETNRLLRAYHLGDTDDLAAVIQSRYQREKVPRNLPDRLLGGRQCNAEVPGRRPGAGAAAAAAGGRVLGAH